MSVQVILTFLNKLTLFLSWIDFDSDHPVCSCLTVTCLRIFQLICWFVVVPIVVVVAIFVAVVVDNTNHVEKDFGSNFPAEMQHFVDLGCYTKFVGGFAVERSSEDLAVASV